MRPNWFVAKRDMHESDRRAGGLRCHQVCPKQKARLSLATLAPSVVDSVRGQAPGDFDCRRMREVGGRRLISDQIRVGTRAGARVTLAALGNR